MSKNIEKEIEKIYNRVLRRTIRKLSSNSYLKSNKVDIADKILGIANTRFYNEFARRFSRALARKGLADKRGVWRKYFRAASKSQQGVIYKTYSEFQKAQLHKAIEHNFKMIKSIPKHILALYERKYISVLKKEVLEGRISRGSFEKQLREHGHKNAKLIARTERSKLQTEILKNRATDLGSVAYIWRSSNDNRTRKSHRLMNNVVVLWRTSDAEKPEIDNMWGNAGDFPNCRCSPNPIFDKSDLTKSSYKVYNYKTHKLITLSKSQLSKVLEKGSL